MRRWLGLLACSLGCSSGGALGDGPSFPTSERFPDAPSRPPSFAAEPGLASALNAAPLVSPETSNSRIRSMTAPLDPDAATELVTRFFMAVVQESTRELFPLLATQAGAVSDGSRQPAQALWRARFAQLDYTGLSGRVVAAPATLRTYTFESAARAKRDGVPAPAQGEVVVVARPGVSWVGKTRLFGEALVFRLRPKAGGPVADARSEGTDAGFEIAEIFEDFRLP